MYVHMFYGSYVIMSIWASIDVWIHQNKAYTQVSIILNFTHTHT